MTTAEKKHVKTIARQLLKTLKEAKLVLDWRKKLKTRADVYSTVKLLLDELPRVFTQDIYNKKCEVVFQHVYEAYPEGTSYG
jgi:type I restriction enzyme R subunit